MSLDFKLTNQNLINYARTDDAHEAFVNSVGNGQARLALEVLVDLVNGIISKLEEIEESINPKISEETQVESAPVEQAPIEEETPQKPKAKSVKSDTVADKGTDAEV
jgi:transcription termination factor NusB